MKNIIIFISGSGTNLQHIIDYYHNSRKINITLVVSNIPSAYGLQRASNGNIPTICIPNLGKTRKQHEQEIIDCFKNMIDMSNVDFILCLGYMRIITTHLLNYLWKNKLPIYNLHPALPDDSRLKGANCIERAYQQCLEGIRNYSGVMIHEMIEEVDCGKCEIYEKVRMSIYESLDIFKRKIAMAEKNVIDMFLNGKLRVITKKI